MKSIILNCTIILIILTGFAPLASAHNLFVEPQTLFKKPRYAPPEDDFSFEAPFIIDNVTDSQVIFSYLTENDVDVFEFEVTPEDVMFGPVLVSASALPPAPDCRRPKRNFPVTALMGPDASLPRNLPEGLPFNVPKGMGLIVANNPPIGEKQRRPIFEIDLIEPELQLGLKWYLPMGLTQECLTNNPSECDFSNTIAQPIFTPGFYTIIMWDPRGKKQDYTATIGTSEENRIVNLEIEDLVRNNGLLHKKCRRRPKSHRRYRDYHHQGSLWGKPRSNRRH